MILLFGSDTLIGEEINRCFDESLQVIPIKSSEVNTNDSDNLEKIIVDFEPDTIINCIEYANIVKAEYQREVAYSVNGFAPGNIAGFCFRNNIKLVHLSSSYIFNGENRNPYSEDDSPDPISVYGDSKLLGEKLIIDSGCGYLIVRVPDVFGIKSSFLQMIMKRVRNYGSIRVIKDQYISPISSSDVAELLHRLMHENHEGIYHLGSADYTSASEFILDGVNLYNENSGKKIAFEIVEKDYREFKIIAERPLFNVLNSSKFSSETGTVVKDWKKSLVDFMAMNGAKI